jgi:RHS repeat-associated protein
MTYDNLGNLTQESHTSGASLALVPQTETGDIEEISSLGRMTHYHTVASSDGLNITRTTITPDGRTELFDLVDYQITSTLTTSAKNVNQSITYVPSQRLKTANLISKKVLAFGPVQRETNTTYSVTLSNPNNPFSVTKSVQKDVTDNLVVTTTYSGKKYTTSTSMGKTSSITLDSYERVASTRKGNLNPVSFSYSNENLKQTSQGSRTTAFNYDSSGYLSSIKNALNQTTFYTHDNIGRVTAITLPDLRQILYTYDSNGNITSVTPPHRPLHLFSFSLEDLVETYAPPQSACAQYIYTYNQDNQLKSVEDLNGDIISYTYDSNSGLLKKISAPSTSFLITPDPATSLPADIKKGDWDLTFNYTGTIPTIIQTYDPEFSWPFVFAQNLHTNGLIDSDNVTSHQINSIINYGYDHDEYLSSVSFPDTKNVASSTLNLVYDSPNGLLKNTSIERHSADSYTYNSYGELANYKAIVYLVVPNPPHPPPPTLIAYTLTLTRDNFGRVVKKTEFVKGSPDTTKTYTYTYDSTGRLSSTTLNGTTVATYAYDGNSNRVRAFINGKNTNGTYDYQDKVIQYGDFQYTYDLDGNLKSKTNTLTQETTTYTYDEFGNLTHVLFPNNATIDYEIDPLNRRIGKKLNGISQKHWIYDAKNRIVAETDGNGNITKRFAYGSKTNIPDFVIDYVTQDLFRIVSDNLGSPRLIMRPTPTSAYYVEHIEYDDFGNITQDTNPGYLPFGFAGGLYDPDTGLVRFGARDYDPYLGRWTTKDPILFKGGDVNLYGYVLNNPVNLVDPLGLITYGDVFNHVGKGLMIGAIVGTAVGGVTSNPLAGLLSGVAVAGFYTYYSINDQLLLEQLNSPLSSNSINSDRSPASISADKNCDSCPCK